MEDYADASDVSQALIERKQAVIDNGAASGELDAEQLFYMRSRGIDEDTAKQILIEAYLEDLFSQIDNEQIREWLRVSK